MKKFRKLIEAGPIGLQPWAEEKLRDYADEIVRYSTLPESEESLYRGSGMQMPFWCARSRWYRPLFFQSAVT